MTLKFIPSPLALATLLFTATLSIVSPVKAQTRGGDGSGGGVSFLCPTQAPRKYYLADTYGFFSQQSWAYFSALRVISTERAVQAITAQIATFDPELGQTLQQRLTELSFHEVQHLDLLGDDDIGTLPRGCQKKQLGVQHFATGIVDYDVDIYWSLTPLERALFRVHEAYVSVYGSNSSTVRGRVAKFAWSEVFNKLTESLEIRPSQGVCNTGWILAPPVLIGCLVSPLQKAARNEITERARAILCENSGTFDAGETVRKTCNFLIPLLIQDSDLIGEIFKMQSPAFEMEVRFLDKAHRDRIMSDLIKYMTHEGYQLKVDAKYLSYLSDDPKSATAKVSVGLMIFELADVFKQSK